MRRLPLLLLSLLLAACEPPTPRLTGSGMDMFAPVTIRLHGLTRFMVPPAPTTANSARPSATILEAHFEFADQFTDPTKAPGSLTLQLFDQPGIIHKGALLQSWDLSLKTPEEQKEHWDRTTRTYVFKLPLDKPLPAGREHVLLTAIFTLANSQVLSLEAQVNAR
ncbi:MAG TPA: hypothetical protein VHM90_20365 [Phycisphaerae bacterium]|nr:hypothetical protein [Phycisphaerae bacterium]